MQFKAKEKGEQPKLFTQLPHRYKYFTKHPLEKHPKGCFLFGGNNRARTYDPLLVRQMLSQLSYAPIW